MFSPSGHVLTIYVLEGVPWKELSSGRSHFSFKFDFQSENELLFFNLNFEKKKKKTNEELFELCNNCVIWSWASPSLQLEMNLDSFLSSYKNGGGKRRRGKKMLSLRNYSSHLNLHYINVCLY